MNSLFIIKGNVTNVVSEQQFLKLYKPNGWEIDNSVVSETNEVYETVKKLDKENEIKNYLTMKKEKSKPFNDKLFFSDEGELNE